MRGTITLFSVLAVVLVFAAVQVIGQSPIIRPAKGQVVAPTPLIEGPTATAIPVVPSGPTAPMPIVPPSRSTLPQVGVPAPELGPRVFRPQPAPAVPHTHPHPYAQLAPTAPTYWDAPRTSPKTETIKEKLREKEKQLKHLKRQIAELRSQLTATEQVTVDVRFLKIDLSKAAKVDLGLRSRR